jgi:hypothetical protein
MINKTQLKCPQCKKNILERKVNPSWPFCCEQCKLIDLGHWLSESYNIEENVIEEESRTSLSDSE